MTQTDRPEIACVHLVRSFYRQCDRLKPDCLGTGKLDTQVIAIMRRSGKSKPVVWAWQARFMAEGAAGRLRDKTRKPGKAPLPVIRGIHIRA